MSTDIFPDRPSISLIETGETLIDDGLFWQGLHVMTRGLDTNGNVWLTDLPYGQAVYTPVQIKLDGTSVKCDTSTLSWVGQPLAKALADPSNDSISIRIEERTRHDTVTILNCIDFIYGHALLKLLNAEGASKGLSDGEGLVVIVQPQLEWLVPDFVSEVWVVDMPFVEAQNYYPHLDTSLNELCKKFRQVRLHPAYSHPQDFKIQSFSRVMPHAVKIGTLNIAYIWRDKRGWAGNYLGPIEYRQAKAISKLFAKIRETIPNARFTVTGYGSGGHFPKWIEDSRIKTSSPSSEQELCKQYATSNLVIGAHGSSMLLPSAHAAMTLNLMPDERWGNVTQDILYQPYLNYDSPALTSFRYRFIPEATPITTISHIATNMLTKLPEFISNLYPDSHPTTSID